MHFNDAHTIFMSILSIWKWLDVVKVEGWEWFICWETKSFPILFLKNIFSIIFHNSLNGKKRSEKAFYVEANIYWVSNFMEIKKKMPQAWRMLKSFSFPFFNLLEWWKILTLKDFPEFNKCTQRSLLSLTSTAVTQRDAGNRLRIA